MTGRPEAVHPPILRRPVPRHRRDGGVGPDGGLAARIRRIATSPRTGAPELRQHTAEVLQEIGVSPDEISELADAGVVTAATALPRSSPAHRAAQE